MKECAIVLELLTVLCTDAATSTGRDPRLGVPGRSEGKSGEHVQLVLSIISFSSRAAEGFGDTREDGAECNHYKSVC